MYFDDNLPPTPTGLQWTSNWLFVMPEETARLQRELQRQAEERTDMKVEDVRFHDRYREERRRVYLEQEERRRKREEDEERRRVAREKEEKRAKKKANKKNIGSSGPRNQPRPPPPPPPPSGPRFGMDMTGIR